MPCVIDVLEEPIIQARVWQGRSSRSPEWCGKMSEWEKVALKGTARNKHVQIVRHNLIKKNVVVLEKFSIGWDLSLKSYFSCKVV